MCVCVGFIGIVNMYTFQLAQDATCDYVAAMQTNTKVPNYYNASKTKVTL